jgi:hypothetical protein
MKIGICERDMGFENCVHCSGIVQTKLKFSTQFSMLVLSTVKYNYLVVDVCHLLHKYQLHVSTIMAIFRLNELTKTWAVIFGMRLIYVGGGGGGNKKSRTPIQ